MAFLGLFGSPNIEKLSEKRDVNGLIKALNYKDESIRSEAVSALAKIGDKSAVPPLIAILENQQEPPSLRCSAIRALAELGDASAVSPLTAALKSRVLDIRREVIEALGKIGTERVIEPLIVALQNDEADVRQRAAVVLGNSADSRAVEPLIVALQDDTAGVRQRAAVALGNSADSRAVEPLIVALQDDTAGVRQSAAVALGNIADSRAVEPLIVALQDDTAGVRQSAAAALTGIGQSAVDSLTFALRHQDYSVRKSVLEILDKMGWVPDADETGVRYWIAKENAQACVRMGHPVVPTLIALLNDNTITLAEKKIVIAAMGQIGNKGSIKPLAAILPDQNLRPLAVEALEKMRWQPTADENGLWYWVQKKKLDKCEAYGAAAVLPLITFLEDTDCSVRRDAAIVLGRLADDRAVTPLIKVLKTPKEYGCREYDDLLVKVVIALGKIGDPQAVEPILYVTRKHIEGRVSFGTAVPALLNIRNGKGLIPLIDVLASGAGTYYDSVDIDLGQAELSKISDEQQITMLIDMLSNWYGKPERALIAVRVLGKIKATRAVEQLIDVLKPRNYAEARASTVTLIKMFAASALGEIGDVRAVEPLLEALKDDEIQSSASGALGKLGDLRAVEPLTELLRRIDDQSVPSVPIEAHRHALAKLLSLLRALGRLKDERAVDAIVGILKTKMAFHTESYEASITALEQIGGSKAENALQKFRRK